MSRDYVMGLMKSLKFVAIPKAYDEVLATARKRKQTTETVVDSRCCNQAFLLSVLTGTACFSSVF